MGRKQKAANGYPPVWARGYLSPNLGRKMDSAPHFTGEILYKDGDDKTVSLPVAGWKNTHEDGTQYLQLTVSHPVEQVTPKTAFDDLEEVAEA